MMPIRSASAALLALLLTMPASVPAAGAAGTAAEIRALTAVDAHALLAAGRGDALFLDVRDPVEIMFTGFAEMVDANIPLLTVDRDRLAPGGRNFAMVPNEDFDAAVLAALDAKGLGRDAQVLVMCRSGSRSAAAARRLTELGFTRVYNLSDGFEGAPGRGSGWKHSGLPWGHAFDPAKIWRGQE